MVNIELTYLEVENLVRALTNQIISEYDMAEKFEQEGEEICYEIHDINVVELLVKLTRLYKAHLEVYIPQCTDGIFLHKWNTFRYAKMAIRLACITLQEDFGLSCVDKSWFEGTEDVTDITYYVRREVNYIATYEEAQNLYNSGKLDLEL